MTTSNIEASQNFYLLFFLEVIERFSFWGLQSVLVFYLINGLGLPSDKAYIIFGSFTAFTFAISILGGFLADRIIGFKQAIKLGLLFDIFGNLILATHYETFVYLGLTLIVIGTSLFTPNNANLLGNLYKKDDPNKQRIFTLFYMGANIGGLLSPLVYGIVLQNYEWKINFIISAILLSVGFILLKFREKSFNKIMPNFSNIRNYKILLYPAFSFSIIAIFILIKKVIFTKLVLVISGLIALIWFGLVAIRSIPTERKAIIQLLIMMLFCLLFFAFEFQVNSSLLLFVEHYVNRDFFHWTFPASASASIEPLFVILLSPLYAYIWSYLNKRNKEPKSLTKIMWGLILESVGFAMLALAANYVIILHTQKSPTYLMLLGNFFLGAGELLIMPTVIAAITKLAPDNLKGTLMGMLYLALAFSGYIAGIIATLTTGAENHTNLTSPVDYLYVYRAIAQIVFGIGILGIFIIFISKYLFKNSKSPV